MNKLKKIIAEKSKNLLAIYFTAGFPKLDDTQTIIEKLEEEKVDIIEVGIPYSDPLADGPTIQKTGEKALENGMNLSLLFQQLSKVKEVEASLVLMGYYNQFLQFGPEKFLDECVKNRVSGLILPDLSLEVYLKKYKSIFEERDICISFLITPQTKEKRVLQLAQATTGFLYMVSSASTTGAKKGISDEQKDYFRRIEKMNLPNVRLIGFGISDKETYDTACEFSHGAIIGSAFLNLLKESNDISKSISAFVQSIR